MKITEKLPVKLLKELVEHISDSSSDLPIAVDVKWKYSEEGGIPFGIADVELDIATSYSSEEGKVYLFAVIKALKGMTLSKTEDKFEIE